MIEAERGKQRPAGEQLQEPGEELRAGCEGALARVAEDGQALARLLQRAADGLDRASDPALAVHLDHGRRHQHRQQHDQRGGRHQEELLGARLEEVGGRDDDSTEHDQRQDVEGGLRDERPDQDREGLAHAADMAGEDHRPGRLAEPRRQGRRHQDSDHRRRGHVAAAHVEPGQRGPGDRDPGGRAGEHRAHHQGTGDQDPLQVRVDDVARYLVDADPSRCQSSQREAEDARDRDACLAGEPLAAAARIVRGGLQGRQPLRGPLGAAVEPDQARSPGVLLRRPDRRRGRLDRALVDLGDLLGDPRPGVALGAAAAGLPHRPDPLGLVGEELELLGKRLRIGRGHQDPVDAVGDDVAVPGDRRRDHAGSGGHRLDQHHAEALAGERGRAEQVRLAQLSPENRVRDLAEHVDVVHQVRVADAARDLLGVRADDGQPGGDVLDQRLEGGEQDRQALALLGPPDEEEPKLVARGLQALRRGPDVDAVGDDRVLAAEPAAAGPGGRLGDGDAGGELVEAATGAEQAGRVIREGLGRVGVERPHDGSAAEDHRVPADDRRQRLVHVDDVVVAGLELTAERDRALRKDREIRDRAVRADAERAPQRDQVVGSLPQLGMGAV